MIGVIMTLKGMSVLDMDKHKHYVSIFNLTEIFQKMEKGKAIRGLEQKHYRYALQKDKNIKRKLLYLKTFFEDEQGIDRLDELYKKKLIFKDCIEPGKKGNGDTLNEFLWNLVDMGFLKVLNPDTRPRQYILDSTIKNEFYKEIIKGDIDWDWTRDKMNRLDGGNISVKTPYTVLVDGYLFGIPCIQSTDSNKEVFTSKEKKTIEDCISKIFDNLTIINKINSKRFHQVSIYATVMGVTIKKKKRS